jgi:hypothetical protein
MLVRAKVAGPGAVKGRFVLVEITIIHVYRGPKNIVGETFEDLSSIDGTDMNGQSAWPSFKADEQGIWRVGWSKNAFDPPRIVVWNRSRQKHDAHHDQAVKLAEVIERFHRTKPEDRYAMVLGLTGDVTVSGWAISILATSEAESVTRTLQGFAAKQNIARTGQVKLDEVLIHRKKNAWLDSEDRRKMLRAWVTGKADRGWANTVANYFRNSFPFDRLDPGFALELGRTAGANEEWPRQERALMITLIGDVAKTGRDDDNTSGWLIDRLRKGPGNEIRYAAAYALVHAPLTRDQRATIATLVQSEKDKAVVAILSDVVKKPR